MLLQNASYKLDGTHLMSLQEDEVMATTAIVQDARGQPPVKRVKRATVQLQSRLQSLCGDLSAMRENCN